VRVALGIGAALAALGCGPPPAPATPRSPPPAAAPSCELPESAELPPPEEDDARPIALVCVRGASAERGRELRPLIRARSGSPLDAAVVTADLRRLFDARLVSHAEVKLGAQPGGLVLTYTVHERPRVVAVTLDAAHAAALTGGRAEHFLGIAPGSLFEPAHLLAGVERLKREVASFGYLDVASTIDVSPADGGVVVRVRLDEGPLVQVASVDFTGLKQLRAAELQRALGTRPGQPFRADALERDLLAVSALGFDRGLLEIVVGAPELTRSADRQTIGIRVPVVEGKVYKVRTVKLVGDVGGAEKRYAGALALAPGSVFSRSRLKAGLEKIAGMRRAEGKGGETTPEVALDPEKGVADVSVRFAP
jgi:outer membrane protein insertion porin family